MHRIPTLDLTSADQTDDSDDSAAYGVKVTAITFKIFEQLKFLNR